MIDPLQEFIQCLRDADSFLSAEIGIGPGVEDIADMLWLAAQITDPIDTTDVPETQSVNSSSPTSPLPNNKRPLSVANAPKSRPTSNPSTGTLVTHSDPQPKKRKQTEIIKPIRIPAAAAMRHPRRLARALKPLVRKTESKTEQVIDEEATAVAIAQDRRMGIIQRPTQERWLELELVIEKSQVIDLWEQATREFIDVLEQLGAFRTIRIWTLETGGDHLKDSVPLLTAGRKKAGKTSRSAQPNELVDATGNRMVMLLSDCISPLWREGMIHDWLSQWGMNAQIALVQWFPEQYWERTSLKYGDELWLTSFSPGVKSHRFMRHYMSFNPETCVDLFEESQESSKTKSLILPVVSLESKTLEGWAGVVAGYGNAQVRGRRFELTWEQDRWVGPRFEQQLLPLKGTERVHLFFETASDMAHELAKLMSLAPVSPEITNLIQETLLPTSTAVHVAEVFLSGLLEPTKQGRYHFYSGVQEQLQKSTLSVDKQLVHRVLSRYISDRYGRTPREFNVFIQKHRDWGEDRWQEIEGFAELEEKAKSSFELPPLQILKFVSARFADPTLPDPYYPPPLYTEEFNVATIEVDQTLTFQFRVVSLIQQNGNWVTEKERQSREGLIESLSAKLDLDMVKIPSGSFRMGSPEEELERWDDESPQHEVTFQHPFYLSRYPITEAQWRCTTQLPQQNRALTLPSEPKGDDHPIMEVSWLEAVEYCDRLSAETGRPYRLPTESEWEYACRAGTTTPFYFGEAISPELANYRSGISYNNSPTGESPGATTPVGQYGANGFGLSDMHGNVWEWCQDNWHETYEGAPNDGSVWGTEDDARHVCRGGSWDCIPRYCRSASRTFDFIPNSVGFRVAFSAPRT